MRTQLAPGGRRWTARSLAVGAVALLSLTLAPAAHAHNFLVESSPEADEVLDTMPDEVVLVFNEAIMEGGNGIVVTGPDGSTTYEAGETRIEDETASIDLDPLDQAGEYTIDYRIISADAHPIEESLPFTLTEEALEAAGDAEGDAEDEAEPADSAPAAEDEQQAGDDAAPAAETGPLGAMPTWVGVVVAIGIIGVIVILFIQFRGRGKS